MEIIQAKKPFEEWKQQVTCTGGSWNQNGKVPCGSLLEIDVTDLYARSWAKYPDISGTDYGFVCPLCNCFTEMDKKQMTTDLKNMAKDYTSAFPNSN